MCAQECSYKNLDTDVVALSVAVAAEHDISQLWVAFGSGKAFRYIGVQPIVQNVGINRSKALALFHSLNSVTAQITLPWLNYTRV